MAPPMKEHIRRETLAPVFSAVASASPGFPEAQALEACCRGLEALALKARVSQVARVLREHLPADWRTALAQLVAALPPPMQETIGFHATFAWWPVLTVVEHEGLADPAASLDALVEMTQRWSGEFAIRPLLNDDLDGVLTHITPWVEHPSPHVRRLVSEGTRPRLPWGQQLPALVADPRPVIPLLARLVDDPELYVRRSVANHLGDIAKDHVDLAVDTASRWQQEHPGPTTDWIVRHGLRHPIKQGHPGALAAQGFAPVALQEATVAASPDPLVLGDTLLVAASARGPAGAPLLIDLVVDYVGARGPSRKAYKWTTTTLPPTGRWAGTKRLPIRPISTRTHHAGVHGVTLQINGVTAATTSFSLLLEAP